MVRAARQQTLKQKLRMWYAVLILVLGLSVVLAYFFTTQRQAREVAHRELGNQLTLQAMMIENWLRERMSDIRQMSETQAVQKLQKDGIRRNFESFIRQQHEFERLVFVNKNGEMELDTSSTSGALVADREYFKAAQQGNSYMSDVMIGRLSGKPILAFSYPTYDEHGSWSGLIFGSVRLPTLQHVIHTLDNDNAEFYVLDWQGTLITAPEDLQLDPQQNVKIDTEIVERARGGISSGASYLNYRNERVYGEYRLVGGGRWIIIGEIGRHDLFANIYNTMFVVSAIIVIFLIVSYSGIKILTRRIERPLALLLEGTKHLKEGGFDYRIEASSFRQAPVELRELCDTFNLMSGKLESNVRLLEEYALLDPLTGLHNRRYMMQTGGQLLLGALASGKTCTVLMVDIDYFKQVNDTYGHLMGDLVLRYIATRIREACGSGDIAVRYGGEEFMVLSLQSDEEHGRTLAEKLRTSVASIPFEEQGLRIPLTLSIGGVTKREAVEDGDGTEILWKLIRVGDQALYDAKRSGRNRVAWRAAHE